MTKACLIIVFNHRYDKNLPVLRKLYGDRFSHIFFLMPFYDGPDTDVIPVYESSFYFQGYFAQAFARFHQEQFTHYIFLGDDCILNPAVNEWNVLEETGIPASTDYIPGIIEFHKLGTSAWWHTFKGIDFFNNRKGAEIRHELPSREEAVERFSHHGIETRPLSIRNIFSSGAPAGRSALAWWLFKQYHYRFRWKAMRRKKLLELPYPVAGSYCDILVITKDSIRDFCRYCGITSAAGLFVEIAIPTALLLASKRIVQEPALRLKGLALWTPVDVAAVEESYGRSLSALIEGFPKDQLFYHPVKLSRWNNDL